MVDNRKGTQFRLGFPLGTAGAVVRFWPAVEHLHVVATSITIAVYAADGTTEKLASTAMTGTSPATYTLDLSTTATWPVGSYQIQHTFVSSSITYTSGRRLMGIYPSVPEPMVTDYDLAEVLHDVGGGDYLETDKDNYASEIGEAWSQLLIRIARIRRPDGTELDPYEIADGGELYDMHFARSLMLVAQHLRTTDNDRFALIYRDAKEEFELLLDEFRQSQLALWAAGPVAGDEVHERQQIRSHVKKHGVVRDPAYTRTNTWVPPGSEF